MQYGHESKFIQTKFYILYFFFLNQIKQFSISPLFHPPNQTH